MPFPVIEEEMGHEEYIVSNNRNNNFSCPINLTLTVSCCKVLENSRTDGISANLWHFLNKFAKIGINNIVLISASLKLHYTFEKQKFTGQKI